MQERVDVDRTPDAISDPNRDPNRETDRELTTADMARPIGTGDQDRAIPTPMRMPLPTGEMRTGEAEARQIHAVPAGNEAHQPASLTDETPLFGADEASGFRTRWDAVQGQFVDDPRHAVEEADHLVAEAIQALATVFADERAELERQWDRGEDISTEDLRVSLQHYRSFFQRLLAA